jgi:hypothetical protein
MGYSRRADRGRVNCFIKKILGKNLKKKLPRARGFAARAHAAVMKR